ETFKTINDLPILHLDTSKFNNSVIYRRKTSCFHVKYDICTIIQRNILCSITNWYTIIYYVCLYTIKYFHPILLCSGICFRKSRSEEHTSELQSRFDLVCRLLLEKKHKKQVINYESPL